MMKYKKKGALELSMTTIIIIVIGVTLLSLAIIWIRGTMEKVTSLSEEAFTTAQQELQQRMGSGESLYIRGNYFNVQRGDSVDIIGGVQNIGGDGVTMTVSVTAPDDTDANTWVSATPSRWESMNPDQKEPFLIRVKVPNDAMVGSKPIFRITGTNSDSNVNVESKLFTVEVLTG